MATKGEIIGVKKTSDNNWTWLPDPAVNGVTITNEPIWSANTGRSTTGKMIGDIVAWKTTIEVSWPPLSFADMKTIRDTLMDLGEFFNITYYDLSANTAATKTVYCGNIPRTLYSLSEQHRLHSGIQVTFIEQ